MTTTHAPQRRPTEGCKCIWTLTLSDPATWTLTGVEPSCKVHGETSSEGDGP